MVHHYDSTRDTWSVLPPVPYRLFGLGFIDEGIVAAGGLNAKEIIVRDVYTFDSKSNTWKKSIPSLPTARFHVSIVSHSHIMAVCGGIDEMNKVSGLVEVYESKSKCWISGPSMAVPSAIVKPVVMGDKCYLVGGYKKWRPPTPTNTVQTIPLLNLLSKNGEWSLLPDTPNNRPVPISMARTLVVIGGESEDLSNAIFAFSEKKRVWTKIGTWPVAFRSRGSATLPSGESIVVGGIVDPNSLPQVVIVSLST